MTARLSTLMVHAIHSHVLIILLSWLTLSGFYGIISKYLNCKILTGLKNIPVCFNAFSTIKQASILFISSRCFKMACVASLVLLVANHSSNILKQGSGWVAQFLMSSLLYPNLLASNLQSCSAWGLSSLDMSHDHTGAWLSV